MIGSWMTGAEITLLSSTIAKGCLTFSVVACANLREPDVLNLKLTIGSPAALIETGLGIGQIAAGHQHLLLDDVGLAGRFSALGSNSESAGTRPRGGLIRRHGQIDHAEFHLGGLAEQFLQPGRILQARHLHQDTVEPLALDQRLDRAEFVDATLDDLDRLLDRLPDTFGDRACGTVSLFRPPPASATSRLRWPLEPSNPPSGCDSSRSLLSAVGKVRILGDREPRRRRRGR